MVEWSLQVDWFCFFCACGFDAEHQWCPPGPPCFMEAARSHPHPAINVLYRWSPQLWNEKTYWGGPMLRTPNFNKKHNEFLISVSLWMNLVWSNRNKKISCPVLNSAHKKITRNIKGTTSTYFLVAKMHHPSGSWESHGWRKYVDAPHVVQGGFCSTLQKQNASTLPKLMLHLDLNL